jgi:amino acid permease
MKKSKILKGLSYTTCFIEGGLLFPLGTNYPWTLIILIPLTLFTIVVMPVIWTRMANAGK